MFRSFGHSPPGSRIRPPCCRPRHVSGWQTTTRWMSRAWLVGGASSSSDDFSLRSWSRLRPRILAARRGLIPGWWPCCCSTPTAWAWCHPARLSGPATRILFSGCSPVISSLTTAESAISASATSMPSKVCLFRFSSASEGRHGEPGACGPGWHQGERQGQQAQG